MAQLVQRRLHKIKTRKASAALKLSVQSDISTFLGAKVQDLSDNLEYVETYRTGLLDLDTTKLTKRELEEEIDNLADKRTAWNKELLQLKRQKRFVVEDMKEEIDRNTIEEAYNSAVV